MMRSRTKDIMLGQQTASLVRSGSTQSKGRASVSYSSSASTQSSKERFRKRGSNSSQDLTLLMHQKEQETFMTFTDIFLQDKEKEKPEEVGETEPLLFVPMPPGLLTDRPTLRQDAAKRMEAVQKKAQARLEARLQDFWKENVRWPVWPELQVRREQYQKFKHEFEDGADSGIVHHCGERLKSIAFVVVCTEKVGVRSSPSFSSSAQTGEVLCPGQMVNVSSILTIDKIQYLKLKAGSGWVFERKGPTRCLVHMASVEIGMWWYQVVCGQFAEVRVAPTLIGKARSGFMLAPGEVCVVALRCYVDETCWLFLADGRGWIFELKPTPKGLVTLGDDPVMAEIEDQKADYLIQESPANTGVVEFGLWEYEARQDVLAVGALVTGSLIVQGERFWVDMRVPASGQKVRETAANQSTVAVEDRIWLRSSDGRGWVPKTGLDGQALVRFVKMAADVRTSATSVNRSGSTADVASANFGDDGISWTAGIA